VKRNVATISEGIVGAGISRRDGIAYNLLCFFFACAIAVLSLTCIKPPRPNLIPEGYDTWNTTTEVRLDYPIPGHEDKFRIIYMNAAGFGFTRSGTSSERIEFPEGTIIAKDIYAVSNPGPSDLPIKITAMVKASSDPAARGGWIWVVKDLESGEETTMSGDFCVRCHANANEPHPYGWKNPDGVYADYVFFPPGTGSVPTADGY